MSFFEDDLGLVSPTDVKIQMKEMVALQGSMAELEDEEESVWVFEVLDTEVSIESDEVEILPKVSAKE